MRKILVLFCFLIGTYFQAQVCHGEKVMLTQDGKCATGDWELVFEDEFDTNPFDKTKWLTAQPWARHMDDGFNSSLEYFTDGSNYTYDNGILKLTAKDENIYAKGIEYLDSSYLFKDGQPNLRVWPYTSGMIYSKEKFGYGKYELRCKIPKGKGLWSVFWLFGENNEELDVFEFWNEKNVLGNTNKNKLASVQHMTSHAKGLQCATTNNSGDMSKEFHVYTLIWDNYKVEWYLDGVLLRKSTKFYNILGQQMDCNSLREGECYIIDRTFPLFPSMNIGVSFGVLPGKSAPDASTIFPSFLEIDYIKYYKASQ